MVWAAFAGIVLQLVGLAVAVDGVSRTYADAFSKSLRSELWRRSSGRARAIARKVFRRKPPAQFATLGSASASLGLAWGNATGQVRPAQPEADASIDEQVAFLMRYVTELDSDITQLWKDSTGALKEARENFDRRHAELDARLSETNEHLATVKTAAFGGNGEGLMRAAVGLAITAFGVLLTTFGLPW